MFQCKQPTVSIVVPVYNVGKYIRQCLDSILSQTFVDYEVILVDDGSTDDSGVICDEYSTRDKRFRVIHQQNQGLAAARAIGFRQSTGEYIATIDSDDWVDSSYLDNMLSCMVSNNADCVVCAYWKFNEGSDTYIENRPSKMTFDTLVPEIFYYKYHAGLWNKLFKRSILLNGKIKTPLFSNYEDTFTYISYLQYASKIVYSDCATYHYRYLSESITNKNDLTFRIRMAYQVLNNLQDLCDQYPVMREGIYYKALCSSANYEKNRLLEEFPDNYNQYRNIISSILPHSYKLNNVTGLSTLCCYLSINGC